MPGCLSYYFKPPKSEIELVPASPRVVTMEILLRNQDIYVFIYSLSLSLSLSLFVTTTACFTILYIFDVSN